MFFFICAGGPPLKKKTPKKKKTLHKCPAVGGWIISAAINTTPPSAPLLTKEGKGEV